MSTSVTATTQPSPYVPPAGSNPAQTASARDQQATDTTQAVKAAKAQGTGVSLDILA
jgi:hypothetical protein